ncbi:hypothetical protein [Polaromonas sp.]|uniref:dioxygenase family protein n=1 Tax=Polaromonas sp. TaxID=1869339 RepID=UPI0025D3350D|nr:hypothetical protein [Polaromonas sp.]
MSAKRFFDPERRATLISLGTCGLPVIGLLPAISEGEVATLNHTPECSSVHDKTIEQTAGPYYRPSSPLRRDLYVDASQARRMTLEGFVLDTRCRPVSGALVEIWHADSSGEYDNAGYKFRGYQFSDANGRWAFATIVTQHYAFRTAHYHFRVQPKGGC